MKNFNAALNALLKTAPKNDVRYYLNGVAFNDSLIVATDGHVLTVIGVNGKTAADFARDDAVILSDHEIKSVQHWLKGLTTGRVKVDQLDVVWTVCHGIVTFKVNDRYTLDVGHTIHGTFPDIARVFRSENHTPKISDIAFCTPAVEKIVYTAKQLSHKKIFKLNISGELDGVLVSYKPLGEFTIESVLMPARF